MLGLGRGSIGVSSVHAPAEQPHQPFFGRVFQRAMTKLGRRALWSAGLGISCFAAAITVQGVGQGLYGTGDWPGVAGSALGLGWLIAVAGVFAFAAASLALAWFAIIRRDERAPGVFVAALYPAAIVIGSGLGVIVALILVPAAVLNEFIPHRSG